MVAARCRQARYAVHRGMRSRRAATLFVVARSGLWYRHRMRERDAPVIATMKAIASRHPSWGYRLVWGRLRLDGQRLNLKRAWRLWTSAGLTQPRHKPRKKRWTGERLKPLALRRNEVWSWDFVHDRYADEAPLRCLTVKDEATGYCLAIEADRRLGSGDMRALLNRLLARHGRPRYIRSDNGAEMLAHALQGDLQKHQKRRADRARKALAKRQQRELQCHLPARMSGR